MMATCTGTTEQETLKLMFSYLVNSIDTDSILPAALSRQLITERQRLECFSEPDPNKKAERFLGHLQRAVNGDSNKFHIFVQLLNESGQESIASHLKTQEESTRSTLAATASNSEDNSTVNQVIVIPDTLSKELADLRFAYAKLLRSYEKELQRSPEAQKEFVEFLPRLLRRNFSLDQTFQLLFDKLIEKEVSLFNIHYLKRLCSIFPEDVCAATRELVDQYEQQRQHFMNGTTVSQFKKLFPASATPYNLSAEKVPVKLKLPDLWGENTLHDVRHLIILLGVPLHLFNIEHGCIVVFCWCSTADVKDLKINVNSSEVADLLQTKGVQQVFIGEELMLECSQPEPAAVSHDNNPVILHLLSETDIDYQCPICTKPLTDPILTDCGHLLCSNCRDHLLSINETKCPTCREPDTLKRARLDKYHQRMVNNLKVRCQYYNEGCKWEGEIRHLQNHLDPKNGNCGIACFFGCGKYVRKPEREEHKKHHCRKRPTTCEYCGYHNPHDIVTEKHYPVCLQLSKKQITNQAVAITPPPATVSPQYLYNLPPVVFTITDYQENKQANKVWTSPPYYTHTRGYKLCLKVYPNGKGRGKGTHISVYAYLMRGEYDNELEWPFVGDINIQVCNWKKDEDHFLETIHLNRYTDEDGTVTTRVMGKETGSGYGYHTFISHTDLAYNSTTNTEYLHDDCLQVRVCDVAVYSTALLHKTPSWQDPLTTTQSVCEFTLTEFSKRKQFNNRYISPPFYTHPQGCKLCLMVYANGNGRGEGTHVTVCALLMRGEHDQHLQWPFTGDIIIELLNWREDKEHCKKSLEIVERHGFVQVTKGTYGSNWGIIQFISHSSLPYNSTTNTEYLQEDCLRLRVSNVIFYSTALLHKTPSWQDPLTTTQSVCEFTLTEFSKRKQFNNEYYGPPFYTHTQGYKLCLRVYVNGDASGDASGKGTYVCIYSTLMRGEHDQHLQWPFTGDIIIELLNWTEDKNHHKKMLKIVESDGFAQVNTEIIYGRSKGYPQFISHSSLSYNSATNTEYLQEDCLRLRVNVANIK